VTRPLASLSVLAQKDAMVIRHDGKSQE
jgi:hypothetical protein